MRLQYSTLQHQQHSLLTFFALVYFFSWMFWGGLVAIEQRIEWVVIFGTYGPTVIALILVSREAGLRGISKLLRRYLIWRVNILWYLFSLIGTAAAAWAALKLHRELGGEIIYQNDSEHWYLIWR